MTEDYPNRRIYFIGFYSCYNAKLKIAKGERLSDDEARQLVDNFCEKHNLDPINEKEWTEFLYFNTLLMSELDGLK